MAKNNNDDSKNKLIEGKDYYFNSAGLMVFTKLYHLKRGYCCKNGCINCPYGYRKSCTPKNLSRLDKKTKK